MKTGTDLTNTQQTIHALFSSAENIRQSLHDGIQYVRGGFAHTLFQLSEIKIDPEVAQRLAHMARK